MRRCNLDCEFLSQFDLFGKEPELYFKGKPQRTSIFGKILTYFYIFIYVAFFIYKIIRMLKKVDISFYETFAFSGTPSIQLTNDLFYGGFSLGNIIDPTIYFPIVYYYEGHRVNGEMVWNTPYKTLELEVCQLNKFGEKYRDIFKDKNLDNLYCLKDVNQVTLEGYSYLDSFKYVQVYFFPCVGYAPDGRQCQNSTVLEAFFEQNSLAFKIQDIELTPHIYDTPSQPLEKDINGPVFKALYQQIYTYMQIVNLETDKDVIGFEGLSDIEHQQFLKYDESWIIAAPSPHMYEFKPLTPICEVTIQLSSKVLTQIRTNTKLIEALGDVGGLMEVVWSMFSIIATVITDILYDKALVNNLFSFDLDKKVVEIKKKKESSKNLNPKKLDVSPKIYCPIGENIKKKINNFEDELPAQSKNGLNEDIFYKKTNSLTLKKKKKKKIKLKNVMSFPETLSNNINIKNVEVDNLKSNNNKIENIMLSEIKMINKETDKEYIKRRIVDRIKMKCCCVYFWFCFARKKKNIQNVLLDEGMSVIVEKLDIINIFKKIYSTEFIEKSLKIKGNTFEMSDICKQKMKLYT